MSALPRDRSLELIEAVAQRATLYQYKMWGFGEGMALLGLLRAAETLQRPQWIDLVADLVAPTLVGPGDRTDHLIPLEVLVELQRLRPAMPIERAAGRFVRAVRGAARPHRDRPPVHRPDVRGLSNIGWVDCLHTDGPGLVLAGLPVTAAHLVDEVCAVLQDGTGLFSHSYNVRTNTTNGVHWGRGQGWALHGLMALNDRRAQRRREHLLEALEKSEQDGRWSTIVDEPDAPLEASVSALVAAGVLTGLYAERISADRRVLATRALHAAVDQLDGDGGLPVSEATPAGGREVYLTRQTGVFPWGQGPLLLALLDDLELS